MEQLKPDARLFLKEDYLGKKRGDEAYVHKCIGFVYGLRFIDSKGCKICSGNLYHSTMTIEEIKNKFTIL